MGYISPVELSTQRFFSFCISRLMQALMQAKD